MTELTSEERKARARRAAELLEGASWAFDELRAACQRDWLAAKTPEEREELHQRATATLTLKGHLMSIVNAQQGQEKIDERRADRTD